MPGDGKLHIIFFNIGFGDCTLIKTPNGKNVMIDGGSDTFAAKSEPIEKITADIYDFITCPLDPEGEEPESGKIDILILTHPHPDHYNKIPALLGSTEIGRIYFGGAELCFFSSLAFSTWLRGNSWPRRARIANITDGEYALTINETQPDPVTILSSEDGGGCSITALAANVGEVSFRNANTNSIVTLIELGTDKIIVAGDATTDTENFMLSGEAIRPKLAGVKTLRVGHHGSNTSSSVGFLDELSLRESGALAIVSCSFVNNHNLPRKTIINRYLAKLPKEEINHYISYYETSEIEDPTEIKTKSNIFVTTYGDRTYTFTGR